MDANKLMHYKQILLNEKRRLKEEFARLTDEEHMRAKESTGELSSYDNHPADQASTTFSRELDRGLQDNTLILLTKVNDALTKIETGRYGICQRCGETIKKSRLEVVPATSFCERCQEFEEQYDGVRERPLAEKTFYLPFRGFNDEADDKVEYDAEDSWQDVAQYGTSDSPQDVPEVLTGTRKPTKDIYVDGTEPVGSVDTMDSIYDDEVDNLEEGEDMSTTFTGKKGSNQK